jgi:hypothetical protein
MRSLIPAGSNLFNIHPVHSLTVLRITVNYMYRQPIPVAARSKAWVCRRSLVGTVVSNPAGGAWMFIVNFVCCQVEVSASG